MALKISELSPIALGTFQSTDLFEVSVDTGGGFVSRKITGSEMIASIGSSNLGNANLVADANQRTYKLLGNLSSDTLGILNNSGSKIVEFQGKGQVDLITSLNVGGAVTDITTTRAVNVLASGSRLGVYVQASSGKAGYFNSTSSYGIHAIGGDFGAVVSGGSYGLSADAPVFGVIGSGGTSGGYFSPNGASGVGITCIQSPGLYAFKSTGKLNMATLPTSASGLSAGDIWNNAGVLNIV